MAYLHRTHCCGELRTEQVGERVRLNGWVHNRRDLGGVIFLDVRDRSGIVQVVCNPEFSEEAADLADKLRNEYVVAIEGEVVERDPDTVNPNLPTGKIEVRATTIQLLSRAKTPPFSINQPNADVDETVRLKYRYLDLRRDAMQRTFKIRHKATQVIRRFLDAHGYLELETPMLTRSTPEGARDYLVPSRIHEGAFYALPQSPQLFKQLLMVSGFERYYQIVRCFRDEDLRADRQPEFTQLDIETSFLPPEALQSEMEEMISDIFRETIGYHVPTPFPRLTYQEAMDRYGTDKPDLRFGLELCDVTHIVKDSQFKVFAGAVQSGGQVKGINAKGCADFSRKDIDVLTDYLKPYGAKGLAWIAVKDSGMTGPIVKFFSEEERRRLADALEAETGDLLLFVADQADVVAESLGQLRLKLARDLDLIPEDTYAFAWITDFPLFTYDEEEGRYQAVHHPFTLPVEEDIEKLTTDPASVRAQAYDMVCNGYEIGGGSMRIYQRDVQEKMFAALGFTEEEAKRRFGFLLEAFEYGTPPHGGIAFGLDRIVMLLAKRHNLRDVIAFPKTQSASCLMTEAPGPVDDKQLEELHISVVPSTPFDD
ncbi:aspartate--tRNA ligase [Novibacillus thermophilus]|uniref:Aspartate--tRNA ligase n=1 Tax=Novibacillus thermophilus TaxID=1471761 RepID=A0A1U9K5D2_9BACL|nr:aspartate--tRNA ligase [Novibacillus thermophilus]AQS55236.1 aspartate--tRNA ligase [Novibacillus thermophilus]